MGSQSVDRQNYWWAQAQDHLPVEAGACSSYYHGVANMSLRTKIKGNPSEEEIDKVVVVQADDDSAWEKPIRVRRAKPVSLSIPAELSARVAFLARLHRKTSVEEWLQHIIEERVELEEAAFVGIKRDLAEKSSVQHSPVDRIA